MNTTECNITTYEQLLNISQKCEEMGIVLSEAINGSVKASDICKIYLPTSEMAIWIEDNNLFWTGIYCGISYPNWLEKYSMFNNVK